MNNLQKKIYETVLLEESQTTLLRKQIDKDVARRIATYQRGMNSADSERLKADFYASCYIAELTGFEIGIHFMKRLWGEDSCD